MARIGKMRFAGFSLKAQLIISFTAVTLLVLSISSYYSYSKTLEIFSNRTQETTMSQFRQIEMNTLTLLREVDKLSNTFLLESKVQAFLQNDHPSNLEFISLERDITERILQYLTNYDYLDSIYIFSDNGSVIGGTLSQNQSTNTVGKQYPFYGTPLYASVKRSFPQPIWQGGTSTIDFMRTSIPDGLPNNHLISSLRGIRWIGGSQMNAVLVFNVNERYFNSSYGSLQSSPGGSLTIVDGGGSVISSTITDSIGRSYRYNGDIGAKQSFGSFSASREGIPEQVVYYRMADTGWLFVNEVPTAHFTKDVVEIQRFSAAVFLLSLLLIVIFSSLWMNRIMKSLHQLIKGMKHVGRGKIGLTLEQASNKEIGQLIEQFNNMSTGILELMQQNEETEKKKSQLEMEALQSQINPHFLFNTLNTVKWMAAVAKAPNIMECMTSLGNMLRPIYYDPSPMWSIREEIAFVKHYVNIMNFRYGDEIRFEIDVPERLMDCRTLRFMIQPSVENALIHGDSHKGVVQVSVAETGSHLAIVVRDTCGGMTPEKLEEINRKLLQPAGEGQPSKGIGIYNVNKRIQVHFGEQYGIKVSSIEDVETSIVMRIPMIPGNMAV
ncbi:sensor histidine kinase [Paenibacillus rhizovicinus]|uniref:Sensor histidine kinase n=1 Tax=Paenibacillus rhizovicinus TaxID=2704463 RepID=A0A6C0P821_9BACL|nr:sensor histidine kinase [Paenibacillus rhizovicinus]QHW34704.1 sensor histidine kinase [Paenibacillus rhizovicinus]